MIILFVCLFLLQVQTTGTIDECVPCSQWKILTTYLERTHV